MNSKLLIYTKKITNRINYIVDFIFVDFLGIEVKLTTDFDEFYSSNFPKISLSNQHSSSTFNFKIDSILIEDSISESINYENLHELGKCFYWLTRYEEYIAKPRQFDKHNRYLGSDLDYSEPIVDKICLEIKAKLSAKFPELQFKKREFKQINTYDVDYAWKYKHHSAAIKIGSLAKKIIKGKFHIANQQINVLLGIEKDPYDTYEYIQNLDQKNNVESIYFWLLGNYSTYDKNHHWKNKKQQKLIRQINKFSKIGIHPSYQSNENHDLIKAEINRLEKIINSNIEISRQHFLKLEFPNTYQQLLINGIKADYSMGFPTKIGFRAGTSTPFKWFDLSTNQQTLLIIYPLVAMDVTLRNYLKLTPQQAISELKKLKQTIKSVDGTFITLFHQSNMNEDWAEWRKVYESIFE